MQPLLPPLTPSLIKQEWDRYIKDRYNPKTATVSLQAAQRIAIYANSSGWVLPLSRLCLETLSAQIERDIPSERPVPRTYMVDFGSMRPSILSGLFLGGFALFDSIFLRTAFGAASLATAAIALHNSKAAHPLSFPDIKSFCNDLDKEKREISPRSEGHITGSLIRQYAYAQEQLLREHDSTLYKPADSIHKETARFITDRRDGTLGPFSYGISLFKGNTHKMEDSCIIETASIMTPDGPLPIQIFGILDGHGGVDAADFFRAHFSKTLAAKVQSMKEPDIWNGLKLTFVELSKQFTGSGGCTAAIALCIGPTLWVANAGTSRLFLRRHQKTVALSEDAVCGTYDAPSHFTRSILNRGGNVQTNEQGKGFLNGQLAIARSIGDHIHAGISSRPKIIRVPLATFDQETDLIISSDGIFENGICSTRQVVAKAHYFRERPLSHITTQIVGASYEAGSRGNVSTLLVRVAKPSF